MSNITLNFNFDFETSGFKLKCPEEEVVSELFWECWGPIQPILGLWHKVQKEGR